MSTKTIDCGSQRIEAAAERLSLCKPATHPIGTVGKLGSAAPRHNDGEQPGKKQSVAKWRRLGKIGRQMESSVYVWSQSDQSFISS